MMHKKKAFTDLKRAITSTPTRKYFDANKKLKLSVDASSIGLAACCMHKDQPVAYASRALNAAE